MSQTEPWLQPWLLGSLADKDRFLLDESHTDAEATQKDFSQPLSAKAYSWQSPIGNPLIHITGAQSNLVKKFLTY